MAAGQYQLIEKQDYNSIQTIIQSVLGVGSGESGYGQPVSSSQVSNDSTLISVEQWGNLRSDLTKIRVHQTNTAVADGLASIAANRGSPYQTLQVIDNLDVVSEVIRDQYSQFAAAVQTNKSLADPAQLTPDISLVTATRTANWGNVSNLPVSVSFTANVTFAGYTSGSLTVSAADHARCFFNAGGAITFTSSLSGAPGTGPSATKSQDWANMLSGFGKLTFGAQNSSITGTTNSGGVSSTTGFHDLIIGGAAVTLLTQKSSISVYNENIFTVTVSRPTADVVRFVFTYNDADTGGVQQPVAPGSTPGTQPGPVVDEPVIGTLTGTVTCTRPSGSNVSINAPTNAAGATVSIA